MPLFGLMGAVLSLPWSMGVVRLTGQRPAAYLNLLLTLVSFIHGAIAFSYSWGLSARPIVFHWLTVADLDLSLALEVSPLSLGAVVLVTGISLLAQVYALGYMEKDWSLGRFFGLMGFFEAALVGIALSDSLLLSYGLLELLTLSTYLLVGFWYAQPLVVTAARDAFLTKRVGDILLLMGIVALSNYGEGLSFSELQNWAENSSLPAFTSALIGLALIAGPTGKCAQFPLNLWLDEAMEGPNPAGILRNSIVVSAGAYVLIKLEPVFTLSPISSYALIIIGTLTAVGASLVSIAQIDIKRTLSHSTSAYLGLVFVAVGLGQVDIAFLLLLTHAIAKALQFMSIGSIIMTTSGQNITEMGGLWSRMPATTTSFLVGSLGLVVLLPLGGFWTFQRWSSGQWEFPLWLLALVLLVNFLSTLNFTRVFRLVFCGKPQEKTRRAPEVAWPMAVPMVTLTVIVLLFVSVPLRWSFWLSTTSPIIHGDMTIPRITMPLMVLSGVAGLLLGLSMELRRSWSRPRQLSLRLMQDFLAYDLYIEKLYDLTVVRGVSLLSQFTAWFDRYVVDGAVNLVGFITVLSGQALRYSSSGQSQFYVLTILIGVSLIFLLTMDWLGLFF
ncbi:MAG: NAD(P)H-quinone oxidoreductase subunit F [Leptolyngbyaceae bacterium]|nr:NAD(P)H-quinone oxidoreductase subunit F [Leptolyngbyaceae bacterium]